MDRTGTSLSFEGIVRADAAFVARVLRRFGVRSADLDDARQDVFLVVHRRLAEFEPRGSHRSWLYRICVCVAADYRKRAHRRHELPGAGTAEQPSAARAEHHVLSLQLLRGLESALAKLEPSKREVFVLYEFEELTVPEIAARLACPLKTAFSRLYAARRELALDLRRAGYASLPALLLWLPAWRVRALLGVGSKLGTTACVVSTAAIVLTPLPAAAPHDPVALARFEVVPADVLVRQVPSREPPAPPDRPRPNKVSPRKRAPRVVPPNTAPAPEPQVGAWISAPAPEPEPAQQQATSPRSVGLDEVLSATSIKPLLRIGPTPGRRFTLVPERRKP